MPLVCAMPGHSIALALARTASESTGGKAATDMTAGTWGPAPNTPRRHAEPLSRMNSLPDLDSDSCSDSSGSSDDEAVPSTSQLESGGRSPAGSQIHGGASTVSSRQAQDAKHDGSEPPMPRQPQLWMGCNCHWQVGPAPSVSIEAPCLSTRHIPVESRRSGPLPRPCH